MTEYNPDWVSTPGDSIQDILEEREIAITDFARKMGFPLVIIDRLLEGKEVLTAGIAEKLAVVLGSTPEFWLKREQAYRAQCDQLRSQTRK